MTTVIRPPRSASYQHTIRELPWASESFDALMSTDTSSDLDIAVIERIEDLKIELLELVKLEVDLHLTAWQANVIRMYYFEHKTQLEIAHLLGVNQSCITKSITGSHIYKTKKAPHKIGGAIRKLKKICYKNEKILNILNEITELKIGK